MSGNPSGEEPKQLDPFEAMAAALNIWSEASRPRWGIKAVDRLLRTYRLFDPSDAPEQRARFLYAISEYLAAAKGTFQQDPTLAAESMNRELIDYHAQQTELPQTALADVANFVIRRTIELQQQQPPEPN